MGDGNAQDGGGQPGLPFWLEITLFETSGVMGHTGQHSLSGRFCALFTRDGQVAEAVASIISRDPQSRAWRAYERSPPADLVLAIAHCVGALGLPDKQPAVEATLDTSDGWTHLAVHIRVNDHSVRVDLPMQCSGFGGADAELFQSLLRSVFLAADCHEWDRSILGPTPKPAEPTAAAPSSTSEAYGAPHHCGHCGTDIGAQHYERDSDTCPSCGKTLSSLSATCVAAPCGHFAPLGPPHCWVCGKPTAPGLAT